MVLKAKEYIFKGDTYQIQVSQRFTRKTDVPPFEIYRQMRMVNPSPYMFYLDWATSRSSARRPRCWSCVEDGVIETHPIAGTRRRRTRDEDGRARRPNCWLDEKERAEHIMLVDLGRNDVGRVAATGTVEVTQRLDLEYYSHVMHIVSKVTGKLRDDLRPIDALRSTFPAGTVSGAPKIRAMEIIAELEQGEARGLRRRRGLHRASPATCDTCIGIRTIWMKDGIAYLQAAGGIVYDSDPASGVHRDREQARAAHARHRPVAEIAAAEMRPGASARTPFGQSRPLPLIEAARNQQCMG